VVQDGTSSTAAYTDVYQATVQETTQDEIEAWEGMADLEAEITWTRAPFFGNLSAGETLINAISIRNVGTGSPDNFETYATGTGDLINEGSPLNIKFLPTTASNNPTVVYLASLLSRTYDASVTGNNSVTSSGTFGALTSTSASIAPLFTARGLKVRVIGRFSVMSTNAEVRLFYGVGGSPAQYTRGVIPNAGVAQLVDFGPLFVANRYLASVTTGDSVFLRIEVRSITGGAINVTIDYLETLFYYDFCACRLPAGTSMNVGTAEYLYLDSFVIKSTYPALPRPPTQAWVFTSSNSVSLPCEIRGTPIRYFAGSSLYAAWSNPTVAHATTQAATVSAFHAPLFKTLRGSN